MRKRRRVARETPRRPRRLVRVADGGDHDRSALHGVRDRLLLEPGVRVAARVAGIAKPPEADVDDSRAVVDGPVDRARLRLHRDRAVRGDDLRDHQLRRRGKARDSDVVVELRGDDAGHDRAVAARVLGGPSDEALRRRDLAREVGVSQVDPRVDHGDPHRSERWRRLPGVVRPVCHRVPLLRRERVGRDEGDPPHAVGLGPGHAVDVANIGYRGVDGQRAERREGGRTRTGRAFDRRGDDSRVGARAEAHGRAARKARRRDGERGTDGERPEKGAPAHAVTRTVSGGPARPSAERR